MAASSAAARSALPTYVKRSHAHVAHASAAAVRHASSSSTGTKSGPTRSDALA